MPCVVTSPCKGCKHTKCAGVCPTSAFYEGEDMLYINPDECIDCDICTSQCPEGAIMQKDNLPRDFLSYAELNKIESQKEGAVNIVKEKPKKKKVIKAVRKKSPTKKKKYPLTPSMDDLSEY